MRKILYLYLVFTAVLGLAACSDDDEARRANVSATGTVTDDDGNEYGWVRIGSLDWTTSNAVNGPYMGDLEALDEVWGYDYIFDDDEVDYIDGEYIPRYGNLMSYEEALKSAPEGWRLPTDDDWKSLERELGMKDADKYGWRGTTQGHELQKTGDDGSLRLLLGGCIMNISLSNMAAKIQLAFEKERGMFWTATPDDSRDDIEQAYVRMVEFGVGGVERISIPLADRYCSVRWVRDAK